MKLLVVLFFSFCISNTWAQKEIKFYPSILLTNGELNFENNIGDGTIERASYKVSDIVELQHDKLNFRVTVQDNKISFNDAENKVIINSTFNFGFINTAKVNISEASFNEIKAKLKSPKGEFILNKQKINYTNLRFGSEFKFIKRTENELPIKKGDIYFSKLVLRMSKAVREMIIELVKENKSLGFLAEYLVADNYALLNGGIHLNEGHFWGQAKLDKFVNIKIKFDTRISLQEENNLMIIKVNKIKASLISIKGKVLKALKDAKISGVKVIGSKVYIDLNK